MPRKKSSALPRVQRGRKKPADGVLSRVRRARGSSPKHESWFEDDIIEDLENRGIEYEYEPETFLYQRPVRSASCGGCGSNDVSVQRRYTPDILLTTVNVYVEAKGKFTSENRAKMEDFLRGDPGVDLRFIFQRDNWITKKHKSKYSDWCKKLGVKYAIGERVPEEWTDVPSASL